MPGWGRRDSRSQVATLFPRPRLKRVDVEILHGKVASFKIDKQRRLGV